MVILKFLYGKCFSTRLSFFSAVQTHSQHNTISMIGQRDDLIVIHVFADIFLIAPIQHHLLVIAGQGTEGKIGINMI